MPRNQDTLAIEIKGKGGDGEEPEDMGDPSMEAARRILDATTPEAMNDAMTEWVDIYLAREDD